MNKEKKIEYRFAEVKDVALISIFQCGLQEWQTGIPAELREKL